MLGISRAAIFPRVALVMAAAVPLSLFSACGAKDNQGAARAGNSTHQTPAPQISYDGRAVHIEVFNDGKHSWAHPLDLVGNYKIKTYDASDASGFKMLVDLVEPGSGTIKYRLKLGYGEAPGPIAVSSFDLATQKMVTLTIPKGVRSLQHVDLVVNNGATLSAPKGLLTIGADAGQHRFTDLAGKQKSVVVLPH